MSPWTPPGRDPVEHAALAPGLPAWVDVPVSAWAVEKITYGEYLHGEFLQLWDIAMRHDPPHAHEYGHYRGYEYWRALAEDERLALLDFLLYHRREHWEAEQERETLETYLHAGGSEWRVGDRAGSPGLEKRVPQGVADAADAVIASSANAGALLSEAWHAAYGRDPDPEEAYEKAIKAVEEAGAEVVLPKNPKATLGTMIATVRNQGDWTLPLESTSAPTAPLEMMRALWEGQESRHGGNGYRKPTPAEAEAAVLLAVALVQFFTAALVTRRTT